ncbi:MAG: cystathionine gamma-synthase family protein [Acidimicrobiia bacterium]|nr:cystathionine gamma-synthase family protein [Acidimicrobiia bacterium]
MDGKRLRPESLMMSYGYNPAWSEGAIKSPIFQTSTFVFQTAEEGKRFFEIALGKVTPNEGEKPGLIYSRLNNPDIEIAEDRLTLWDGAEDAALFKSGMAAISTTLLTYLRPGDLLVASEPIYGGTHHLIEHILPKFGIDALRFDCSATAASLEAAIEADGRTPGVFLIETPSNPTNSLIDIAMCAEVAAKYRTADRPVPLAVDNTFLGPVFCHPLQHGADIVLYSATKYIGGHSDLIAGAAVGSMELIEPIREFRTILGTQSGPWEAWMIQRSLETLQIRMTRQQETASRVADFLRDHPKVQKALYLGHIDAGHPQHDLYKRQCLGPGAMIAFEVPGGEEAAFRFLNHLTLIKLAVSLGSTESLAEHPKTMTHSEASPTDCDAMGVTDGLIRLSIGVEHPEDLILDIGKALEAI